MASHGMTGIDVRVLQRRVSLHRGKGKGQEEEGQSVLEEAEGPQVSVCGGEGMYVYDFVVVVAD